MTMETKYYAILIPPDSFNGLEETSICQIETPNYTMNLWDCKGNYKTVITKESAVNSAIRKKYIVEIDKKVFDTLKENAEKIKKLIEIQNTTIKSLF